MTCVSHCPSSYIDNTYYIEFFKIGQQKINFSLYELGLPEAEPIYTLKNDEDTMAVSILKAALMWVHIMCFFLYYGIGLFV